MSSRNKYRLWYFMNKENWVHKLTFDAEVIARQKLNELEKQQTVVRVPDGVWGMVDKAIKPLKDWILMQNYEIIDGNGANERFEYEIKIKKAELRRKKNKKESELRRKKNKKEKAKKEKQQKIDQEKKRKEAQEQGKDICSCGGIMALTKASSVSVRNCDQCNSNFAQSSMAWVCQHYPAIHPTLCVECKTKDNEEKKEENMEYTQLMKQYKLLKNDRDKLQDDYNVITAQFNSLQMEFNKLKDESLTNDKSLKIAEASHNILKTKCDSLDAINKKYEMKINEQIDVIKKLEQMNKLKNMDDEKKEDYIKCKVSFKCWLHDVVNLARYLELFEKNESDDIRYIEFFDQDTIRNDIGIKHVIHCKFIMKKINEFKKEQTAFNSILDRNQETRSFKTQFEVNGILTMEQLKNEIKTKKDLAKILQLKTNDDKIDGVWNALFAKQMEIPPMIAPKNNEGNITDYI